MPSMQMYKASVRPGGQITHEVPRDVLSAPEVVLLRAIHGDDAVVHLSRTKKQQCNEQEERERLTGVYGAKAVTAAFGNTHGARLPTEVPDAWVNNKGPAQAPPDDDPLH